MIVGLGHATDKLIASSIDPNTLNFSLLIIRTLLDASESCLRNTRLVGRLTLVVGAINRLSAHAGLDLSTSGLHRLACFPCLFPNPEVAGLIPPAAVLVVHGAAKKKQLAIIKEAVKEGLKERGLDFVRSSRRLLGTLPAIELGALAFPDRC